MNKTIVAIKVWLCQNEHATCKYIKSFSLIHSESKYFLSQLFYSQRFHLWHIDEAIISDDHQIKNFLHC